MPVVLKTPPEPTENPTTPTFGHGMKLAYLNLSIIWTGLEIINDMKDKQLDIFNKLVDINQVLVEIRDKP